RLLWPVDLVSGVNLRDHGSAQQVDDIIGIRAGGQSSAVGREPDKGTSHDCFESNDLATGGHIPQLQSINAGAGEGPAICGKSHIPNRRFVTSESRQFLLVGNVTHLDQTIPTSRRPKPAAGRNGNRTDASSESA